MTAEVYHADLWGLREVRQKDAQGNARLIGGKCHWRYENDVSTTTWATVEPDTPFYLFVPQEIRVREEYMEAWKVTDAMPVNGVGMTTARDHVVIDFEGAPILQRYDDLTHYQRVVAALKETIRLMAQIDQTIDKHGGWPIT